MFRSPTDRCEYQIPFRHSQSFRMFHARNTGEERYPQSLEVRATVKHPIDSVPQANVIPRAWFVASKGIHHLSWKCFQPPHYCGAHAPAPVAFQRVHVISVGDLSYLIPYSVVEATCKPSLRREWQAPAANVRSQQVAASPLLKSILPSHEAHLQRFLSFSHIPRYNMPPAIHLAVGTPKIKARLVRHEFLPSVGNLRI